MSAHPEDLLSAYIDNELSDGERRRVEAHLSSCQHCRAVVDDLLELQFQVSTQFQSINPPIGIEQQIMQKIEYQQTAQSVSKAWFAMIAGGLLSLIGVWLLFGPVLVTLSSVAFKCLVALTYMLSSIVTSVPILSVAMMIFAVFIGIISSLSLRRLLRTTN